MKEIKREDGNIISWITFIFFIIWVTGCSFLWYKTGFDFEIGTFSVTLMLTLMFGGFMVTVFKSREKIKTISFEIYEFQLWNEHLLSYQTRYDYARTSLMANYYLTFRRPDSIDSPEIETIKNNIKSTLNYGIPGYETKEHCMYHLIEDIKEILKNRKINVDINIKDINFVETVNVDDMIETLLKK